MRAVKKEDLSFIFFRTNEENTKALLSFCLRDDSEQLVTAQVVRSDDGNIRIYLWQGAYNDADQKLLTLLPKSPIPGLTQSIVKEGTEVEGEAVINGFNVAFEMNPSTPENFIFIGGMRISLKNRGIMHKAPGSPKFTISRPVTWS